MAERKIGISRFGRSSSCATGWHAAVTLGLAPAPRLPADIIARTAAKYREALRLLTS
jgi:hypothetical protein